MHRRFEKPPSRSSSPSHSSASNIWRSLIPPKFNRSRLSPAPFESLLPSGSVAHGLSTTWRFKHSPPRRGGECRVLISYSAYEKGYSCRTQPGLGRCLYVLRAGDAEDRYGRFEYGYTLRGIETVNREGMIGEYDGLGSSFHAFAFHGGKFA